MHKMLNKYVVRQPIKDAKNTIFGYEIMFDNEKESLYNQSDDYVVADSISGFLAQNNEKIFNEKITFMTFTSNLLFKNTPMIFARNNLVIQIEDNVIVHPLSTTLIQKFRKAGYQFAINDFQFAPRYFGLMEYIDYIKLNFKDGNKSALSNIVKMGKGFHKKCIAYGIDSKEIYDLAAELDVDYYQGSYVAQIMTSKSHKADFLQSNFFQLVVEITKDEPNVDVIEGIISRDAALSYSLLKMVNSAYFAQRKRTSSIRQALVIVGLGQLKQWVYLLSFNQNEDPMASEEVLKVSFLRANFCAELLNYTDNVPLTKSEAYLMGMFSTLDTLIDAPMKEILDEIPIAEDIKSALLLHEGSCGLLYDLVLSYERAAWDKITSCAEQLGIPTNVIAQIYFDCVEEVNVTWESLVNPYNQEDLFSSVKEEEENKMINRQLDKMKKHMDEIEEK